MNYSEMLAALTARGASRWKLGCEPTRQLLAALGRPDLAATNVVVAGTNGKGSTSALLAAALQQDGRRVGLFTSPHLVHFTERIRIDGEAIAQASAPALYQRVVAAAGGIGVQPTFFECTCAMAAVAFMEARVDIGVWEVGVGGRLDATNAVSHQLSVITRIALDHQDLLGTSLSQIAAEKAGVIAPCQPVVLAPQARRDARAVRAVVARVAARQKAALIDAEPASDLAERLPPYQRDNIGCAWRAAQVLGTHPAAFRRALDAFHWPGRYHWLSRPAPVLLDGAHNEDGMRAFAVALRQDARLAHRRLAVVFSSLRGRDAGALAAPLRALPAPIFVCPSSSRRSLTKAHLMRKVAGAAGCDTPALALARARASAGRDGVVLVAGSLALVGDVLGLLGNAATEVRPDG